MSNSNSIKEAFSAYSIEDWHNWIDDILSHGIAYPISTLSPLGDVLSDICEYLSQNEIPGEKYDLAINEKLDQEISLTQMSEQDLFNIERLLDVIIIRKSNSGREIIKKLFQKKEICNSRGRNDFIVNKVFQVLSKHDLEQPEIRMVFETSTLVYLPSFIGEPSFVGNFLRFVRIKYEIHKFFEVLSIVIEKISNLPSQELMDKRMVTVIVDKLIEVHYYTPDKFYSSLYLWVTKYYKSLSKLRLFPIILLELQNLFTKNPYKKEITSNLSSESKYGNAANFLLAVINKNELLNSLTLTGWVEILTFILNKSGPDFIKYLFEIRSSLLSYYFSIYKLNLMHKIQNDILILDGSNETSLQILNLINEALQISFKNLPAKQSKKDLCKAW